MVCYTPAIRVAATPLYPFIVLAAHLFNDVDELLFCVARIQEVSSGFEGEGDRGQAGQLTQDGRLAQ